MENQTIKPKKRKKKKADNAFKPPKTDGRQPALRLS